MFKNSLEIFELEEELRRLAISLRHSFKPIGASAKRAGRFFWWFLESPKLYEKIGPDRSREVSPLEKRALIMASMHPPSHHLLK